MERRRMTMFYHYSQNNSGGSFDFNEESGITHHVVIEADSAGAANARAIEIGLYWDGVGDDIDCACCGDRWYEASGDGDAEPMVYSRPIGAPEHMMTWMDAGKEICVHYADGRKEWHS
jgi:hypothetical protein